MPSIPLSAKLRSEYETLFNTCNIRPERAKEVNATIARIQANKSRYVALTQPLGIPWGVAAVIHCMETGLSFLKHLHNGDPLAARTVQVPPGRPKAGNPPFTWEESALDALTYEGFSGKTDWSLAGTLYQLEKYNGFGYRTKHPDVLTPYLWSYSEHYQCGKFVKDGKWSDTAVSKQCGAAVLLRRMAENNDIEFPDQPAPTPGESPAVVSYSKEKPTDPEIVARAEELQRWLNTIPGIFVKVDGWPGDRTSNAYRMVTGAYLPGDPRA